MVEPILYASLGALLATLAGLLFLPFFWSRAVRLTTKRLIDKLPVSVTEMVAAQDRLRAELAMSMRETERKAERAIGEATRDRVESARARATELGHLADISELRQQVGLLEAEGLKVKGERDKSGEQAAAAYAALQEAKAAADQAARDLQAARQDASASRAATEQARVEAAEREAEVTALRQKIAMLGLSGRSTEAARLAGSAPRMPHVDRPFEMSDGSPAAPQPAVDAASLAALRKRLDEVADQIVKAAESAPAAEAKAPDAQPAKPEPRLFFPQLATKQGAGV